MVAHHQEFIGAEGPRPVLAFEACSIIVTVNVRFAQWAAVHADHAVHECDRFAW